MPPRAVWKIRPSGVVPYRLMWARSSLTRSGGMGMVLVSWAARCFRPRSWRAVPWSVQAVPARDAEVDPPPALLRQVQVAVAEHDRLRGAQRGVVQAGEEGFQVLTPAAQCPDGGEEAAGLGGSAVAGSTGRWSPLTSISALAGMKQAGAPRPAPGAPESSEHLTVSRAAATGATSAVILAEKAARRRPAGGALCPRATGSGAVRCTDGHGRRGWERHADRPQERYADHPAPRMVADLPCES
jgi:hypothetical protein